MCSITKTHSNLQDLLDILSPRVEAIKRSSTTSNKNGYFEEDREIEIFNLNDLWRSFNQCSAYGAGVPILLDNINETIVQYYSPTLSALQIRTNVPIKSPIARELRENKENGTVNGGGVGTKPGYHYLEYNETTSPYERIPFSLKIMELAEKNVELLTLQSIDLSCFSWMAIAWYPIYQIPLMKNVEGLNACFLTYHSLSTYVPGHMKSIPENEEIESKYQKKLPPFAATTYKMFGKIWISPETSDHDVITRHRAFASTWLETLEFDHHDYNFFTSHIC